MAQAGTRELHVRRRPDGSLQMHPRETNWSRKAEDMFFAALAQTANVAHALRVVGISQGSAYKRRRRHAHFAAGWDAALDDAKARVESDMLARALAAGTDVTVAGEAPAMDDRTRLALLARHGRGGGRRPRNGPASIAEAKLLRRELIARLDRLADVLEREDART